MEGTGCDLGILQASYYTQSLPVLNIEPKKGESVSEEQVSQENSLGVGHEARWQGQ